MSDFDFDEIDKAVANALTPDEAREKSESREDTSQESRANEPARKETVEVSSDSQVTKPAPAARRSTGRFMDVVHPSSDMRTQSAAAPSFTPPTKPSRDSEAPVSNENEADDELFVDGDTPLDSPFLPDAKVEKRPLGGFAAAKAQDGPSHDEVTSEDSLEEELLLEAPDELRIEAHVMPDPIDFAAHANSLPSENEDTGTTPNGENEIKEEVTEPQEPARDIVEEGTHLDAIEATEVSSEPEVDLEKKTEDQPVGPASITQQYTEQPSSAPSSGAIYDTETYHKPLAPVEKKHSGVWTFIWILLLVILGAGAGVAFYLFVLPMF